MICYFRSKPYWRTFFSWYYFLDLELDFDYFYTFIQRYEWFFDEKVDKMIFLYFYSAQHQTGSIDCFPNIFILKFDHYPTHWLTLLNDFLTNIFRESVSLIENWVRIGDWTSNVTSTVTFFCFYFYFLTVCWDN